MDSDREVSGASLRGRALSGLMWVGSGQIVSGLLQIGFLIILARLLEPEEFGIVGAGLIVIGLGNVIAKLGLGEAIIQREKLEPAHQTVALVVSVSLGMATLVVVWLLAPILSQAFDIGDLTPVLRALGFLFPLRALFLLPQSLLKRDLAFGVLIKVDVLVFFVGYGLVATATALAGWGLWALVAGHLAAASFTVIAMWIKRRPDLGGFSLQALRELSVIGVGMSLGGAANLVARQGDNLVVGRWLGADSLGVYGRAYALMAVPANLLAGILDTVLFPTMARLQDRTELLARTYRRGIASVALVVGPLSATMLITAPELIDVLLGDKWSATVVPFQYLVGGMLFRSSHKISESLAAATGAVYRRAWRQAVYAALIVSGAFLGRSWGLAGVSVGVLVALGINFSLMAQLSVKISGLGWREFVAAHWPAARLTAVAGAATWIVLEAARHWDLPSIASLVLAWLAMVGTVAVASSIFPRSFIGTDGVWFRQTLVGAWRDRRGRSPLEIESPL